METDLAAALQALERAADTPGSLSRPFVEVFPITGAAVSTVGRLLGSETVSASDSMAARLDELQFDLGEGPCWDAMNLAKPILEPRIRKEPTRIWPAFSRALEREPVSSLFAFPLMLGNLRIGAVDLYSVDEVVLDAEQARQAGTMADAVSRHVLRKALDEVGIDRDERFTPFSRRIVHQATGMIIAQLRIPADEALLVIQGHAFAENRPMMEVAQDITDRTLVFSQESNGIEDRHE